jgi:hypothetical protein
MKMTSKLKINHGILLYKGLIFYPIKPSAGLFILIKSRKTIPSTSLGNQAIVSSEFPVKLLFAEP